MHYERKQRGNGARVLKFIIYLFFSDELIDLLIHVVPYRWVLPNNKFDDSINTDFHARADTLSPILRGNFQVLK